MDFGLGLILSFTDNASGGIQNAVNSLNQLTETASNASNSLTGMAQLGAFSVVADQMGSSLMSAGKGVLGLFTNLLGNVKQTGSEFESFRITLNALYGDAQTAEKQIDKLLDFSIKSPFEVDEVKDMLVVLKSQGIDAFTQMKNAAGDFQQENLAWIADLMAFKPDIPAQRWKLAITNFLGSGETRALRNALDMGNIEQLLGHAIGSTAEERMQDLIQIVDQANLQGLADNMSHTWQGVASNVSDAFTKLYKSIGDNGVFDKLKSSFMGVAGAIMQLDNDELEALGKTIADGLNIVVAPLTFVAEKVNVLVSSIVKLCQTNPELVKFGIVVVAVVGALLLISGVALKFMSSLGMLTIGLTQFGVAFSSIGGLLRTGALKIVGTLLPLTLTLGLIYLAWKTDFGNIRTMLTNFVANVRSSFDTARQATKLGVGGMMNIVTELQSKGDFWSNFTVGLIKVKTAWEAVKDAWNDYTLSEDMFLKCKELGILPLVEAILDFKWRFDHFKEGFIEGWNTIGNIVSGILVSITKTFEGTFLETIINGITRFFQALSNNDPETWRKVGVVIGEIAAVLLPLASAMKIFNRVTSLGGILPRIFGGGRGGRGGNGGGSGSGSGGNGILSSPAKALKMMGSITIILGETLALLEVIGMLSKNPYFTSFLESGAETMTKLAASMLSVSVVVGALGLLTAGLNKLSVSPSNALKGIADMAILIGGLDLIVTAIGALNKIPYMSEFLGTGVSTLSTLSSTLLDVAGISVVLGGISAIFSALKISPKTALLGISNLAILLGGLDVLITAVGALNNIPYFAGFLADGVRVMSTLTDVLKSMFSLEVIGTIGLISAFGFVPVSATALGIANLAIVLGGLTVLIEAFGALSKIPGFNEFLSSGGDTLANLFSQVGKCVGAVIGGFAEGVTDSLPAIGTNIADFGNNVKPFFEMTSTVDTASVGAFLSSVGDIVLALTGEKLLSFVTGGIDLPAVGTQLSDFATSAKPFFDTISGIPESSFTNADKMFASLDGLNNYSFKSGGALQAIIGEVALDQVGTQLSSFATNGQAFFSTVENISETAFANAEKLFASLDGINQYSFKDGGLAQLFTGSLNLDGIGTQLSSFATNAGTFFDAVATIPETSFTNADKMFASLEGLNSYSFKSGGLAQLFTGTLDLSNIGQQLSDFATNASSFFTTAGTVDGDSITNAVKIFDALGGLDAYEFKSGGLAQLFTGSFDIADVGSQLSNFATNAKVFFDTAATVTGEGITSGEKMLSILATIGESQATIDAMGASWGSLSSVGADLSAFAENSAAFFTAATSFTGDVATKATAMLNIMDNLDNIPEGTKTLKSVGDNLSSFAENASGFFDLLSGLDDATISRGSSMATMISGVASVLQGIGDQSFDMSGITSQLTDFASTLTSFATQVNEMPDFSKLTEFTSSLSSFGGSVRTASSSISTGFSTITTSVTTLESAISTKFGTMQTTVTTKMTAINTMVGKTMTLVETTMKTKLTTMVSTTTTSTSSMQSSVSTSFGSIKSTISSMMASALGSVTSNLNAMKSAFANARFYIPQTHISLPHFSVSGSFSANPPSVPNFSVAWYKKGGIFNEPSIIGVGEAGREAVLPLENNNGWINDLAYVISKQVIGTTDQQFIPVDSSTVNHTSTTSEESYMTSNVTNNNTTTSGNTDNSVTFAEGSIQINCKNASEEEALRMARKIMEYIKRKKELDKMLAYG